MSSDIPSRLEAATADIEANKERIRLFANTPADGADFTDEDGDLVKPMQKVIAEACGDLNDAVAAAQAAQTASETARDQSVTAKTASEAARDVATTKANDAETARAAAVVAKNAADADAAATAADRTATHADKLAADADAVATAADRVQTGLDRAQTGSDRTAASGSATTATTQAGTATTQAGIATTQATNAAASAALASSVVLANVAPHLSGRAARGGIVSTGAGAVASTPDNGSGFLFGTTGFAIGMWLRANFTSGGARLVTKRGANNGFEMRLNANAIISTTGNGAGSQNFNISGNMNVADGAWAFLVFVWDRTNNSLIGYVNGAQWGTVSIAAIAGVTMTNNGTLVWGADGSGANPTAGTYGESWIISGVPTATQIANIYQAGSIAPFAASFTFFQWCDFGQGYGPIIKDLSGLKQPSLMGTSGLSHALPVTPRGNPHRAPRVAIVSDGTATNFLRNALGIQNPGTAEVVVWWEGVFPSDATSTPKTLFQLTASTSALNAAQSLYVGYDTTNGLYVMRRGASGGVDYRYRGSLALLNALAGKRGAMGLVRSAAGISLCVGIDFDFVNVTNLLGAESTGGTAPAWTDTIDGQYLVGFGSASAVAATSLFDLRTANVAMTEAQLRTEYERGEPGAEWADASRANRIINVSRNSVFTAGSTDWVSGGGIAVLNTGTQKLDVTFAGSGFQNPGIGLATSFVSVARSQIGNRVWRLSATISNFTGTGVAELNLSASNPANNISGNGVISTIIVESSLGGGGANPVIIQRSGGPVSFSLSGITMELLGWNTRLRSDNAAGLTALNSAKSVNNDSSDFSASTTGITVSPDGRVAVIRWSTTTNGNQQLFGAACVDSSRKWRIRSWTVNCASGTPTFSGGNASGGAQYVNALALAAGLNDVSTFVTRLMNGANVWVASNSTAQLDHVITLDLQE